MTNIQSESSFSVAEVIQVTGASKLVNIDDWLARFREPVENKIRPDEMRPPVTKIILKPYAHINFATSNFASAAAPEGRYKLSRKLCQFV